SPFPRAAFEASGGPPAASPCLFGAAPRGVRASLAIAPCVDAPSGRAIVRGAGVAPEATRAAAVGAGPMTNPDTSEHPRQFPRYEVNAYVDYTGNEVLLFHRLQNISLGGVCIQTSGVEEVGTVVDLVLNFPDLDASIAVRGE